MKEEVFKTNKLNDTYIKYQESIFGLFSVKTVLSGTLIRRYIDK